MQLEAPTKGHFGHWDCLNNSKEVPFLGARIIARGGGPKAEYISFSAFHPLLHSSLEFQHS